MGEPESQLYIQTFFLKEDLNHGKVMVFVKQALDCFTRLFEALTLAVKYGTQEENLDLLFQYQI